MRWFDAEKLILLNNGAEKTWECLGQQEDKTTQS